VIQEKLRLVLNAIYEPIFASYSINFGFRPRYGCHNPLCLIVRKAQGMIFDIEGETNLGKKRWKWEHRSKENVDRKYIASLNKPISQYTNSEKEQLRKFKREAQWFRKNCLKFPAYETKKIPIRFS